MDQAKRGADALKESKFAEAIEAYTAALKASPTSPDYFIKRSTAYQRSTPPNFTAALSDAENAVVCAQKRAKRELIVQAQLRRAIALFGLERYGDAEVVLGIVKRMDEKEKSATLWENKIKPKLAGLEKDDPRAHVTVTETPNLSAPAFPNREPEAQQKEATKGANGAAPPVSQSTTTLSQTPASKIRHDWYQTTDSVIFTLLAKGIPKDKATIDIHEQSLTISFPLLSDSTYDFSLDPLYAPIDPSQSKYNILPTKLEITLRKRQPGHKWHALESDRPADDTNGSKPSTIPSQVVNPSVPAQAAPSYPTSSRTGPKNWDKVVSDITAKKPKSDAKPDPSRAGADEEDDYDYDKEEGDEASAFFKQLYKDASPDVRRAMMKSYTESNGTALSTNWGEVKKGKVETVPPDSMEAKKWGA